MTIRRLVAGQIWLRFQTRRRTSRCVGDAKRLERWPNSNSRGQCLVPLLRRSHHPRTHFIGYAQSLAISAKYQDAFSLIENRSGLESDRPRAIPSVRVMKARFSRPENQTKPRRQPGLFAFYPVASGCYNAQSLDKPRTTRNMPQGIARDPGLAGHQMDRGFFVFGEVKKWSRLAWKAVHAKRFVEDIDLYRARNSRSRCDWKGGFWSQLLANVVSQDRGGWRSRSRVLLSGAMVQATKTIVRQVCRP